MSSNFQEIKTFLEEYEISPKKSLGQNFLIDQNIVDKIIKETNISEKDLILEVGPGLGTITKALDKKAKKVLAIEKDTTFAIILKKQALKNTEIIEHDILKYIKENDISKYKVVANIPYYLTSFLIRNLLETENQPKEINLIIQKEVAERVCANKKNNQLAMAVGYYADAKKLFNISKNSFWPRPKVESALIQIKIKNKYSEKDKLFFKFLKAGFSAPRKKVINNLSEKLKIDKPKLEQVFIKNNIDISIRAESLNIEDWKTLAFSF